MLEREAGEGRDFSQCRQRGGMVGSHDSMTSEHCFSFPYVPFNVSSAEDTVQAVLGAMEVEPEFNCRFARIFQRAIHASILLNCVHIDV